jgi:hypothetical protein
MCSCSCPNSQQQPELTAQLTALRSDCERGVSDVLVLCRPRCTPPPRQGSARVSAHARSSPQGQRRADL